MRKIYTGIDIGSDNIKIVVAEVDKNDFYVLASTSKKSKGIKRGLVVNREEAVSSLEEARASAVDFDGSVFFFPDLANKCIYTKQINVDGTATLLMYELKEIAAPPQPNYVTREEFENTIMQLKNSLVAASAPTNQPIENKQELKF